MRRITVMSNRGFQMDATAKVFQPKNWLYVDFGRNSRICIDMNTGEIIKGQSHCAPVLATGEVQRLVSEFSK